MRDSEEPEDDKKKKDKKKKDDKKKDDKKAKKTPAAAAVHEFRKELKSAKKLRTGLEVADFQLAKMYDRLPPLSPFLSVRRFGEDTSQAESAGAPGG